MSLNEDVDLEELISMKDELSGADIKAVCSAFSLHFLLLDVVADLRTAEAGLLALRERRMRVNKVDFTKARENVMKTKQEGEPQGLYRMCILPFARRQRC